MIVVRWWFEYHHHRMHESRSEMKGHADRSGRYLVSWVHFNVHADPTTTAGDMSRVPTGRAARP